MTHYDVLEVSNTATPEEIKRAYRKKASIWHPDKEGGDTEKFKTLQVAYDTLSDPQKRQQYDMQLAGGPNFGQHQFHWEGGADLNEIFRQFGFGSGSPFGQFRYQQQPRRNKDFRIEIQIPLADTLVDQTKTIQLKTTSGMDQTIEVKVPRGVSNETVVKYAGLGDNLFETLPRGDLYVHFRIHNVDNFHVNGLDLYTQLHVNCLLAVVGGKVQITGLDGKIFELVLPKGTQPGKKLRIPQQGLYQTNSPHRGDLYVEVALTVPENLTAAQLNAIDVVLIESELDELERRRSGKV